MRMQRSDLVRSSVGQVRFFSGFDQCVKTDFHGSPVGHLIPDMGTLRRIRPVCAHLSHPINLAAPSEADLSGTAVGDTVGGKQPVRFGAALSRCGRSSYGPVWP